MTQRTVRKLLVFLQFSGAKHECPCIYLTGNFFHWETLEFLTVSVRFVVICLTVGAFLPHIFFSLFVVNFLSGTAPLFLCDCHKRSLQRFSILSKRTRHLTIFFWVVDDHSRYCVLWKKFSIIFCSSSWWNCLTLLVFLLRKVSLTFSLG